MRIETAPEQIRTESAQAAQEEVSMTEATERANREETRLRLRQTVISIIETIHKTPASTTRSTLEVALHILQDAELIEEDNNPETQVAFANFLLKIPRWAEM